MGGFLVPGRVVRRAVDLDQHEAGRVIGLLDHVEAGNAWLFEAVASILQRGGLESLDLVRFDVNMNVDATVIT